MPLHRGISKAAYWKKLNGDLLRIVFGLIVGFGCGFYTCWVILH